MIEFKAEFRRAPGPWEQSNNARKNLFYLLGGRSTPKARRLEHRAVIGEARNARRPALRAAHRTGAKWVIPIKAHATRCFLHGVEVNSTGSTRGGLMRLRGGTTPAGRDAMLTARTRGMRESQNI